MDSTLETFFKEINEIAPPKQKENCGKVHYNFLLITLEYNFCLQYGRNVTMN